MSEPTQGPYIVNQTMLNRQPFCHYTQDGKEILGNEMWIQDSEGRLIAEARFSTVIFDGKPLCCNNFEEAKANAHQFAASWLMREALKKSVEFEALDKAAQLGDLCAAAEAGLAGQEFQTLRDAALLAAEGKVQP
jgi:hypothetical protein